MPVKNCFIFDEQVDQAANLASLCEAACVESLKGYRNE